MKTICCIIAICLVLINKNHSQTTLKTGDIAFVTVNADANDNFDILTFVDIETNTIIHFTDNAWNGQTLQNNEGTITFTATEKITKGSIISYTGIEDSQFKKTGTFNISGSGDNILVYQGESAEPAFIFGIGWAKGVAFNTSWISEGDVSTVVSYLPANLTEEDFTAVNLGSADNYQYKTTAIHKGSELALLENLTNPDNFNSDNDNNFAPYQNTFTISQTTGANIKITSSTLTDTEIARNDKDVLLYRLEISIKNESAIFESVKLALEGVFEETDFTKICLYISNDEILSADDKLIKTWTNGFKQPFETPINETLSANKDFFVLLTSDFSASAKLGNTINIAQPSISDFVFSNTENLSVECEPGATFSLTDLPINVYNDNFETGIKSFWTNTTDWKATTSNISGTKTLQHTNANAGTSYIAHAIATDIFTGNDIYWQFKIKNGNWEPSSSNNFRFYLTANNTDLTATDLNGYAIGVNFESSDKQLSIWKVENNKPSKEIIQTNINWTTNMLVNFKVVRKANGLWQLYTNTTENSNKLTLTAEKYEYATINSVASGLLFNYTATRAGLLWFDDYTLSYKNAAPVLLNAEYYDTNKIKLLFSEPINKTDAQNISNYKITNATIKSALWDETNASMVIIECNNMESDIYEIYVSGIKDLTGEKVDEQKIIFEYTQPAKFGSIVINELMIDPSPTILLPEHEYIEIYNTTEQPILMTNWTLTVGTKAMAIPEIELAKDGYLIICNTKAESFMGGYGDVLAIDDFPALNNTSATISLKSDKGILISGLTYNTSWHTDSYKADGGWALEKIDPTNPTFDASNWKSSEEYTGGTPGGKNSVLAVNPDFDTPKLLSVAITDEQNLSLSFSEPIEYSTIKNATINIDNHTGTITKIEGVEPFYETIKVSTNKPFEPNTIYTLTINSITDWSSNQISTNNTKQFAIPAEITATDIIINEILFDPKADGCDFVEIYNKSNKVLDVSKLKIASKDEKGLIKSFASVSETTRLIMPEEYQVITSSPDIIKTNYYCENENNFITVKNIPSYANDEGRVVLMDLHENIIDEFVYSANMHFPLITNKEGVSLERISFNEPTNQQSNWSSASEESGFGTPTYKNSQNTGYKEEKNTNIALESENFSPNNDGNNDMLHIHYNFENAENIANIKIFDSCGKTVKYLINNELMGTKGTWTWNGLNDNNEKAKIGIYVIYIEIFNKNGNVETKKMTCVLSEKL